MADEGGCRLPGLNTTSALETPHQCRNRRLHHDKHPRATWKANTALEKLADARNSDDFGAINKLQKDLAFNLSGHVLHSLFWQNLSPEWRR